MERISMWKRTQYSVKKIDILILIFFKIAHLFSLSQNNRLSKNHEESMMTVISDHAFFPHFQMASPLGQ